MVFGVWTTAGYLLVTVACWSEPALNGSPREVGPMSDGMNPSPTVIKQHYRDQSKVVEPITYLVVASAHPNLHFYDLYIYFSDKQRIFVKGMCAVNKIKTTLTVII